MGYELDQEPVHADSMTLGAARDWLRRRLDKGAPCPCCTQFAKVYKRPIYARMAHDLIRCFRRTSSGEFFHLATVIGYNGGDTAKLAHWGLLEEEGRVREDGGRGGYWRITPAGVDFVLDQLSVPSHAHIYDGRCLGRSGDPVTIVDALGTHFRYDELMAA